MKVIVSSDGLKAINFEQAHTIKVDTSQPNEYTVQIDGVDISHHKKIESAKRELYQILSTMKLSDPVIYEVEDSK